MYACVIRVHTRVIEWDISSIAAKRFSIAFVLFHSFRERLFRNVPRSFAFVDLSGYFY